ncbi:MAG TPA: hypothetical protein VGN17_17245 [Bryobacteraceae bacterium]|jgi:hypothetical protein
MKALPLLVAGFGALAALAQFPIPGGGGGPLGGQGPLGGGQGPGGRRQPQQQKQDSKDTGKGKDSRSSAVAGASTEGRVRRATATQLVIEPDDHRIIWYRVNGRTVSQKDGKDAEVTTFAPGDRVTVDSTEDDQGFFTAVEVQWQSAGTAADRAGATATWDLPTAAAAAPPSSGSSGGTASRREPGDDRPVLRRNKSSDAGDAPAAAPEPEKSAKGKPPAAPAAPAEDEKIDNRPTTEVRTADNTVNDADDPGKPKLKRGAPATARTAPAAPPAQDAPVQAPAPAVPAAPVQTARNAPAITAGVPQVSGSTLGTTAGPGPILPQEDPLITKARDVAGSYADTLPNFFCQQMTTRYQSNNPRQGWDALDIVTADLAYQDGKESYKNIKVGNKVVNKPMEEIPGSRSTGEFSSQMDAILRPGTGATFKRNGEDRIRNRSAVVFKFEIPRERSGWRIEQTSELYYPAYRGSIWIDKETSRVMRIEQEARGMPSLFPLDTVESSTDYDFVRLAVGQDFLLPVEAEVLSCVRGTSSCSRNKIEFRNYRKFGAESDITFGDPPAQK